MASGNKVTIVVAIGLAAVAGAWIVWTRRANVPVQNAPPLSVTLPASLDYFYQAQMVIVDDQRIGFSIRPLDQASLFAPEGADQSPQVRNQLTVENSAALKLIRQGLSRRGETVVTMASRFGHYDSVRACARLLCLEALDHEAHGRWRAAAENWISCMRMGADLSHEESLSDVEGISVQAIGRIPITRSAIDHLSKSDCLELVREAETADAQVVPFDRVLTTEYVVLRKGIVDRLNRGNWQMPLYKMLSANYTPEQRAQFFQTTEFDIIKDIDLQMRQEVEITHRPGLSLRRRDYRAVSPIVRALVPNPAGVQLWHLNCQAQNRFVAIEIALHGYSLDHHAYPDQLSALVPAYLKNAPADPFAVSGAIRYRRQGTDYLLYSVGPDGHDDGGRPVFYRNNPSPYALGGAGFRRSVDVSSHGDVVAGVTQ
jgi:hypothetical protein